MELSVGDIVHYYMLGEERTGVVEAVHPKGKRVRVREAGGNIRLEWTRNRRGIWRDVLRVMELHAGPGPEGLRRFQKHRERELAGV